MPTLSQEAVRTAVGIDVVRVSDPLLYTSDGLKAFSKLLTGIDEDPLSRGFSDYSLNVGNMASDETVTFVVTQQLLN